MFYQDVMRENYAALASLGTAELLPLSAFLSPTEPEGTMGDGSRAEEEQEPRVQSGLLGGPPKHSLPLSALVQLVKGIPEFLLREVPESSEDNVRASPAAEPTSKPGSTGKGGPAVLGSQPQIPSCSPDKKSCWNQEGEVPGPGFSPGSSPLQGLIDCLREILVPGPQHPEAPPSRLYPHPTLSRLEPGSGSPPLEVKVEATPGACFLQHRPGQLTETPEAISSHPSPSGARPPPQQEGPWASDTTTWLHVASRASSSPLEALEACLKGIPLSGSSPWQPSTTSWSWSPQQGPSESPRPEPKSQGSYKSEVSRGPLPPLGLQGPVRDHAARHPGLHGSPATSLSSSSTGHLDFRSSEGRHRHRPGIGTAAKPSPLHHLERSLEGMLPVQPLRFSCLASPSPSPSPSPSSSEGENQRLEAHLGPLPLQAPPHLTPCLEERPAPGHEAWQQTRSLQLAPDSSPVTANSEVPAVPTGPVCPCRTLQQELSSLSTTLSRKLDWLATTLASLSRDVAAMKDQVNRLRWHPQAHKLKGWGSRLRPRAYRCPPYRRRPGPARPRHKLLRGPGEGGSVGPPVRKRQPPGTARGSAPPLGLTCGCVARTVYPPETPHLSPVPAPMAPQTVPSPEASAVAAPAHILTQLMDTGGAQGTVPKASWGGGHGEVRWAPC
ncbi:PREDICTED: protein KRBA1 [Chrysochloris asiatica]|uniref:Protein KRBA1 n=1 Tax=Chrysochloris asiatica TaxID=185453 RepID=A0A9B0TBB5_CHRAS|nr:PREDICTED: protein KRBA1 [Chrysochloris asiatica]